MVRPPVIALSDAWLLDSEIPAVRHQGKTYQMPQELAMTEVLPALAMPVLPALAAPVTPPAQESPMSLAATEPRTLVLPSVHSPQPLTAVDVVNTELLPIISPIERRATQTAEHRDAPDLSNTAIMPAIRRGSVLSDATAPMAAMNVSRCPTRKREEPLHFCYECGSPVPPWRDACFMHNTPRVGLPRAIRLLALEGEDFSGQISSLPTHNTRPLPSFGRKE